MKQNVNNAIVRTLCVACLLFTPKIAGYSQTILLNPAEFYIGTSHGVNASMIGFYPKVKQKPMFGYNGGMALRYVTEKHVGLQVEINYSQRGWTDDDGNYTRRLNYIEMPLLTHIYLGNTHRLIINLGPKLSYLLNESVLINNTKNSTAEQHVKPVYFPFDYGITLGTGYNLHTKKAGVFQLEIRAYYGLSDIFANTKADYFNTSNHWNASVNLGWFLQLTGKK